MALDKDIAQLKAVPLFGRLDPGALRLMAFAADRRAVADGGVLFRAGDAAEGGVVVVSGEVELIRAGETEPHRVVGPGALLGERALAARTIRPVTARARGSVTALLVSRSVFTRVLEEHPADAADIRRRWAAELHDRVAAFKDAGS